MRLLQGHRVRRWPTPRLWSCFLNFNFLDVKSKDQKFAAFKRDLDEKEAATQSQLKKLKTESKASSAFNFKGNNSEVQYEFNSSLLDRISPANSELERVKTLINKRNKLIHFVDKSPAGWTSVEEYESDELADDSEDEKKNPISRETRAC